MSRSLCPEKVDLKFLDCQGPHCPEFDWVDFTELPTESAAARLSNFHISTRTHHNLFTYNILSDNFTSCYGHVRCPIDYNMLGFQCSESEQEEGRSYVLFEIRDGLEPAEASGYSSIDPVDHLFLSHCCNDCLECWDAEYPLLCFTCQHCLKDPRFIQHNCMCEIGEGLVCG
jgi:hypothetical protein